MNAWADLFTGIIANRLTALVSALLLIVNVSPVSSCKPADITEDIIKNTYNYTKEIVYDFGDETTTTAVDDWTNLNLEEFFYGFANDLEVATIVDGLNGWQINNGGGLRKGGYWDINQCKVNQTGYGKTAEDQAKNCLVITTEYLENGVNGAGWYTAGIRTNNEYKYGYFECRCILPKGEGLWSAFWLTNYNAGHLTTGNATKGAEIDVFESPYYFLNGRQSWKVTSNIHYNGYELQTRYKNVVISALNNNPYENFNTYGLLWTPTEYVFYINGHEVGRTNYGGVSQESEYAILSCEVDGAAGIPTKGWSGIITNNKDSKNLESKFIVDYVKIYQAEN